MSEMPPADEPTVQQLRVDTHTLAAFGRFIRRELDGNIARMARVVSPALTNGAMVGTRLPSNDVESMNAKHGFCLDQMALQLESYTANLAIIADAAKAIAARYQASDELAAASSKRIELMMEQAIGDDTPPPPTTPHGALV